MAMLTPPNPRFKPMLSPQDMGGPMQPQQVLREAPKPAAPDATGRTPAQIAKERAMAEAMIGQGLDFSPVQHWTQGAARLANELAGMWDESRLAKEEEAGRAGFKTKLEGYQKSLGDPATDKAALIAQELALVDDPWASDGAKGFVNAQMAGRKPQDPTNDQRNYIFAQSPNGGNFKGTFADYQTLSHAPMALAAGASPNAPTFEARNTERPVPAGVQSAEDDDIEAVQSTEQINNQLQSVADQINDGTLDLGFFANLASQGQNYFGASTKGSIAYANMKATLEKMRNDSLRLNKGVQTDMDAVRAWNELIANINDPKVVLERIATIKDLNMNAKKFRLQKLDIRRERNKMDPFDPSAIGMNVGAAPAAAPAQAGGWKIEVVQ